MILSIKIHCVKSTRSTTVVFGRDGADIMGNKYADTRYWCAYRIIFINTRNNMQVVLEHSRRGESFSEYRKDIVIDTLTTFTQQKFISAYLKQHHTLKTFMEMPFLLVCIYSASAE